MELKKQVCSLELAQKLKELGVKQGESIWSWWIATDIDDTPALNRSSKPPCPTCSHPMAPYFAEVSAFTVAELGEMLGLAPQVASTISFRVKGMSQEWTAECLANKYQIVPIQVGATEADARAKMLIYLLENRLVGVADAQAR